MTENKTSHARGFKAWLEAVIHLPKTQHAIHENQRLTLALQEKFHSNTEEIRLINHELTLHNEFIKKNDGVSLQLNHELQQNNTKLQDENNRINEELHKFKSWFESINVVSSKTSYGEMLIYSYDRVQCSRVIPEINYEEHLLSGIVDFLNEDYDFHCENFIDIGSNIGTQSVYMLTMNLTNKVIAFEPDPSNYKLLRSNFIINGVDDRAVAINSALGDFDGEVEFELSKDNLGDHRVRLREFEGWVQNEQYRDVIKVDMKCPHTALSQYNLDYRQTLIWLDAQGLEGHILTSFLNDGEQIRYFVCEYWPYGIECAEGRKKFFEVMEKCESIYDIRNMNKDAVLTLDYLNSYYDEAVMNEANHKVFSIDLLCVIKS